MRSQLRGPRAALLVVALGSTLASLAGTAHATYTGVQDLTTFGAAAAGGSWIAVPQHEDNSDPGTIDGTPFDNTTSSLEVAHVPGPRYIAFRSVSAGNSMTMGPMLVAGARNALAVAWTDTAGAGQINSAELNASGNLPAPTTQAGAAFAGSLHLATGPDGAYVVSWQDAAGAHAMAEPVATKRLTALLGPDVPLDPAARVVLSGGQSFWLVNEAAGGLSAAPAVLGQDTAPVAVTIAGVSKATTLGDGAGGLWALARGNSGWLATHVDRSGGIDSTPLPTGTTSAVIALAGTSAVIAYRSGPRCASYIERLRTAATGGTASGRASLTTRASGCATPSAIAVDRTSATAYVLLSSARGTTLATETSGRATSRWRGSLKEHVDTLVAVGSGRVALDSNGPQRDIGEQCGGAGPSFSQAHFVRVFHGTQLEGSGRLEGSAMSC